MENQLLGSGGIRLRLRSLILTVLLASILVITVSIGIFVYSNLYDAILKSYERKLFAADVATGLFIDGDVHDQINLKRSVNTLAYDPAGDTLYGTGTASGTLMTLDVTSDPSLRGGANVIGTLSVPPSHLTGMTWDTRRKMLVALARQPAPDGSLASVGESARLLLIDPRTARVSAATLLHDDPAKTPSSAYTGIAYDPASDSFWTFAGSVLYRVAPGTGQVAEVGDTGLSGPFSPVYVAKSRSLYCLCADGRSLARLSPETGKVIGSPVTFAPVSDDASAVSLLRMGALAFDSKSKELFGATHGLMNRDPALLAASEVGAPTPMISGDRLGVIAPDTGQVTVGSSVIGYRNEQGADYVRYVRAMRHVRKELNLTYIYTMVPDSGNWIRYVIDPTEGKDHTNIGWPDLLTDEHTVGVKRVIEHSDVFLSDIHAWERWGLLKSAYAPIYSHRDTGNGQEIPTRAIAGMDINIDVIQTRTRTALTTVGVVALASLLFGSFTTLFITRRLTEPIAQVKDAAIKIASGQYGGRIRVTEPRELADLAHEFNRMSTTLARRLHTIEAENAKISQERRMQELARSLAGAVVEPSQISFTSDEAPVRASSIMANPDGRLAFYLPSNRDVLQFDQEIDLEINEELDEELRDDSDPSAANGRAPAAKDGGAAYRIDARDEDRSRARRDASGYVLSTSGDQALIWLADAPEAASAALRQFGDLSVIAERAMARFGLEGNVTGLLEPLLSERVYAWIVVDSRFGRFASVSNRPVDIRLARGTSPSAAADERSVTLPLAALPEAGQGCLVIRAAAAAADTLLPDGPLPEGLVAVVSHGLAGEAETYLRALLPAAETPQSAAIAAAATAARPLAEGVGV